MAPVAMDPAPTVGFLATATRLGYLAFFAIMLGWLVSLPSPWFHREQPGDVVSFNLHPVFMGVAFVILMPEALLAYADVEERRGMRHADAKSLHAALNGASSACILVGLCVIFTNHAGHGIPPMYSAHSWIGLASACLVAVQALVGATCYLAPPAWGLVTSETRAGLMPAHRFLGCAAFALGVAAAVAGFAEKQSFVKCADPADKHCAALTLPNWLALLAAAVAACALGAVYARWTADGTRGGEGAGAERERSHRAYASAGGGQPGDGDQEDEEAAAAASLVAGGSGGIARGADGARAASRWRTGRQMGSPRKS